MARKTAVWANVAGASLVSSTRRAQSLVFRLSRSRRKVTKKAAVFFTTYVFIYQAISIFHIKQL